MTPEDRLRAARRITEFLNDDVVGGVLTRMERRYYEEFLAADTSELRVRAWAKARTLKDLEIEMKTILDASEYEVIVADREAKKKMQQAQGLIQ